MQPCRRQFLKTAAGACLGPAFASPLWAESYPLRPVRVVVGFPPGGVGDVLARLEAQWLAAKLGQPFIVENRPGAGGNLAAEAVINAPPDGHTLLFVGVNHAINATLYEKLKFDFVRDIAPVAGIARIPNVMVVHPSFPATNVPEFVAYAKANPGKINMASAGNGTSAHVTGELFKMMAAVDMVHVPYRGGAPAVTDLLAGHVQVYFGPLPESIEHIRAGKLRALAVTSTERLRLLPSIPAMGEYLSGYEASGWQGLGAPKKTPPDVVTTLNKHINNSLSDPEIRARLSDLGGFALSGSPLEFGQLIAHEIEKWGKVIKAAGISPE
jgi:tripartite-type tricarboxylate transporter receptor subunit TctC